VTPNTHPLGKVIIHS